MRGRRKRPAQPSFLHSYNRLVKPPQPPIQETNSKRAKKDDEKRDTGNSPYDDTNAYYDYIKKFISFEVSKNPFFFRNRNRNQALRIQSDKFGVMNDDIKVWRQRSNFVKVSL
ncbi:hypothetical protein YC2023_017314 [Brassica napus]